MKKLPPTSVGGGTNFDREIWEETLENIKTSNINSQEIVENLILFLRRVNLSKFIAQYEVFKKSINVPGAIIDCGVFKGQTLMTWAKLVEILCPGDTFKHIIGFDTFSGFTKINKKDGKTIDKRDKKIGGFNSKSFLTALENIIQINQKDSMIPRFSRVKLVKGDVVKTIPKFVKENQGLRISLLHLDMDLYEPTKVALENLYPLVSPGGIVLLDEYGMQDFEGESKAFDEYFGDNRPKIFKFPYTPTPGAYFIKEN